MEYFSDFIGHPIGIFDCGSPYQCSRDNDAELIRRQGFRMEFDTVVFIRPKQYVRSYDMERTLIHIIETIIPAFSITDVITVVRCDANRDITMSLNLQVLVVVAFFRLAS